MRIGFLSTVDPRDPGAISGMPFHMRRELSRLGDVVDLTPFPLPPALTTTWSRVRRLAPARWRQTCRDLLGRTERRAAPMTSAAAVLAQASAQSLRVAATLAARHVDVLFGCCVSTLLYRLETHLPIVYASDTTARLLLRSYPDFTWRPAEYHDACELLERTGLRRARHVVLATELARRSAVEDFGVAPANAHAVPLGANLAPATPYAAPPPIAPPSRGDLRLAFIGLDPVRKRLDLAVEVVDALRAAGWAARLEAVGRPTERALASPWVTCHGPLDLASPIDRRAQAGLLLSSHLLLLPSTAEAYGIAPCEAAHFGRPSVVSAVGGLPEVVLDGETGVVVPADAGPRDLADAIVALVDDPARYQRVSEAALRRAQAALSWDRWREAVAPLLADACAGTRADERGAA